jgi:uncharacterized repeat protein (TIGR03803 family)
VKRFFILLAMVAAVLAGCPGVANAQTVTLLHSFTNETYGFSSGPLLQGSDCNLYGATYGGGINTNGSVFSITTNGSFATVCSFPGQNDGTSPNPAGWLIQGSDGGFYGMASTYSTDMGTVFRATTNGIVTTLYSFFISDQELPGPWGPIALGGDGYIYGATVTGGTNGIGSVFKVSTNGAGFTNLIQLSGAGYGIPALYGIEPYGGVVQGTDGNFYGTTSLNGPDNGLSGGTVFRITSTGAITNLHVFNSSDTNGNPVDTDGNTPQAALGQGYDGNFYGVTSAGGDTNLSSGGYGTIFQISSSGTFTTLHRFNGVDGEGSSVETLGNGLMQASDGNLYGVSVYGGNISVYYPNGLGTIFRISPGGNFTTVYNFSESDLPVSYPYSLIQGQDGSFYGTAYNTIFKLTVPLNPPPNQISALQVVSTNVVITVPAITGEGYQLQYSSSLTTAAWSNVTGAYVSNSLGGPLTFTDIGGAVNTQRFYQVEVSSCAGDTFTDPVGYMTLIAEGTNGPANYPNPALSLWGLGLTQIPALRGTVASISGAAVGIGSLTAGQYNSGPNGPLYYIEDTNTNGSYAGFTDDILSNDANNVYTTNDDSSVIQSNDTFKIYPHWTLATLFGTNDSAGLNPGGASTADQLLIQNPVTKAFSTYFYATASKTLSAGWKNAATDNTDYSNQPLYQNQGIVYSRPVATNLSFQLVGAVKLGPAIVPLFGPTNSSLGYNLAPNVYATTTITLSNSGLYTDGVSTDSLVAGGASTADQVLIHNDAAGVYSTYFYATASKTLSAGWKNAATDNTDAGGTPIPQGASVLILLQSGHNGFSWKEPAPPPPY